MKNPPSLRWAGHLCFRFEWVLAPSLINAQVPAASKILTCLELLRLIGLVHQGYLVESLDEVNGSLPFSILRRSLIDGPETFR